MPKEEDKNKKITADAQIKILNNQIADLKAKLEGANLAVRELEVKVHDRGAQLETCQDDLIKNKNDLVLARERELTLFKAIRVQAGHDLQVERGTA